MARSLLLILQGILPLLSIYLAKLIVDTLTASLTNGNQSATLSSILLWLALAGGVTLLMTLCNSLSTFVQTAHSLRVTDYMQGLIHAQSIAADLEYYENAGYYDTLRRAQQEASQRPAQILNRLAELGRNAISLLAMAGLLFALHPLIVLVLFVTAIPTALVRSRYARLLYRWQRRRTPWERQSRYLGWLLTTDLFAKEIRLFNLGPFFSQWYQRLRQQLYQERLSLTARSTLANFFSQGLAGLFVFGIYAYLVYQALQEQLTLGDLVLYHQALQRGQSNLKGLFSSVSGLDEDNLFLANLFEFFALKPRVKEPLIPEPVPPQLHKGVEFQDVDFYYPGTTRLALNQISLQVRPGETIALVGENGSGKTTLIKLLCRLYDPTAGTITLDGIDLRQFAIPDLRRHISVIFQDYAKYHLTAQENIWLGDVDLPANDAKIPQAACRAGADEVIRRLPQGYDTRLGKLFADGEELSIGQWQKIALARAFLRESPLIVLDEPTSALDPQAEAEVFGKFRQLIDQQAAILISHRLSTVKMVDRIYVMAQGKIVERGTHSELMQQQGTYAHLFETQAQQYR
ncbi:MAG: ATP-binding cassette domain-containing protein [Cyanobacteria bacterium]|jgi:ATP-binding cassette subfamily B protein|nr:ATP-binding cassette domain-containing protein [Cyanobacteria bacterium GSL.Bin21]